MEIKLTFKKIRQFVFLLILFLGIGLFGYRIGLDRSIAPAEGADLSLFWFVWHRLEEKYLDQGAIVPEKMIEGAISGMVSSLGDPYTVFLPPEDNKVNKEDLDGEFGGIGIRLGYKDRTLAVISPLKNTPAEEAGVKAGDLILRIKDKKKEIDRVTEDISLPEAVKLIRGKEGTIVTLTLVREGTDKPFDLDLVRATIVIPSLEFQWLEEEGKRYAYVHLLQFSEQLNQDWLNWTEGIKKEKNQADFGGVILDLRNNPGGYLQGAVFVAGEFVPRGEVFVWQEDYQGRKIKFPIERNGSLVNTVPLVVLVNNGTASAAEILAGGLRDYQRTKVVGQKTFGKGTIQEPEELPGGAGLHVTTARWLLPNGDSIDHNGIEPDFKVEIEEENGKDLILEKGIDVLENHEQS